MNGFVPYTVELSTALKRGDDERVYNDKIKANENYINQNFQNMAEKIAALEATIKILLGGT